MSGPTFQLRALSDIVADIQYRFSIGGVVLRHPATRIKQLYNVAWQAVRETVSEFNDGSFLKGTDPANLPITAPVTDEVYAEIDWPISAIGVYGVRVKVGTRWYPLKRIPWAAYQDFQYQGFFETFTAAKSPRAYVPRYLPDGNTDSGQVGKIMIIPVPQTGVYRLWYLEAWQPQTADGYLFSGHTEFIELAILETLIKMLGPDGNQGDKYTMWSNERKALRDRIETRASRLDSGTSMEPRDARGDGRDVDAWGEFGAI